jgi:hypothetical protein
VVVARIAMGFQFPSIAAVGSFLVADLELSYAQLGTLIGLAVMVIGILGAAAACGGFALGGPAVLWSALLGLLVAPAAGVVALAGEALPPRRRNTGFGSSTWSIGTAGPRRSGWPPPCGSRPGPPSDSSARSRGGGSPRGQHEPGVAPARRRVACCARPRRWHTSAA